MSDVSGAAPAAAESSPVAEVAETIQTAEPTPRGAIDRAFATLEKQEAAEAASAPREVASTPEVKPVETEGPRRGPDGKFLPKEAAEEVPATPAVATTETAKPLTSFVEPPGRFSPDAKAAWKDAPESVRAEVHRALKELETGHQKYKADAEAFADVGEFADLAAQSGTTLKQAMANYVGIEKRLRSDPVGGLERICQNLGLSLRDVAAHVMGQKPEANASRQDGVIRELRNEIAQLRQSVGGVTKTIEQQRTDAVMASVAEFAAKPEHSRFEELSEDIKFFIGSGRTKDLSEAYRLAERLNPAPAVATNVPASTQVPAPDPQAQTPKGQLSLAGAPSSGSNPAHRKPSTSSRESIDRAFAQMGIG